MFRSAVRVPKPSVIRAMKKMSSAIIVSTMVNPPSCRSRFIRRRGACTTD